jgi:hypothetical protein
MLALLFVVMVAALFYVLFLIKNINQVQAGHETIDNSIFYVSTSTKKEIADPKVMTKEERTALKVSSKLKIEVVSRNAAGEIMGYKIIK